MAQTRKEVDMGVVERINILMVKEHVANVTRWAEELGIRQGVLSRKVTGKEPFNFDQLMKILEHHPNVSADWLLKGKGDIYGIKEDDVMELKKKLAEQSSTILELTQLLANKNKQIDVLLTEKVNQRN